MAQYEVTLTATVEAANDAEAESRRASLQKQAASLKAMLGMQGIKVIGDVAVKATRKA